MNIWLQIKFRHYIIKSQESILINQESRIKTQESRIKNPQCTGMEARLGPTAWPAGHQSEMAYQAEHQWEVA